MAAPAPTVMGGESDGGRTNLMSRIDARWKWLEKRERALRDAIAEHVEDGVAVPPEWVAELRWIDEQINLLRTG